MLTASIGALVSSFSVAATENDETNGPMLAVNTRLGYRPSSRRVEWERSTRGA